MNNPDNGRARLLVLESDGSYLEYQYESLAEARAYVNSQSWGDFVIVTDHTLIFAYNGYRTKPIFRFGISMISSWLNHADSNVIETYRHYLEISKGMTGHDTWPQYSVMDAFVANVDGGD